MILNVEPICFYEQSIWESISTIWKSKNNYQVVAHKFIMNLRNHLKSNFNFSYPSCFYY